MRRNKGRYLIGRKKSGSCGCEDLIIRLSPDRSQNCCKDLTSSPSKYGLKMLGSFVG
jgi:hypothetical protein